jgi:hypothetical protein
LEAGASLQKKDLKIIIELEQAFDSRYGIVDYIVEPLGAMADLRDGHARSAEIEKCGLYLFENDLRQSGRACIEIVDSLYSHYINLHDKK